MFTDLRIKLLHFFRKHNKIIFIVICVWAIVFFINYLLKGYKPTPELQTTYEPHTSVIDTSKTVSKNVSNPIEDKIEEYVGYCNEGNWQKAFNMLSDSCKEYGFNNDIQEFMKYVYTKMPTPKKYAIQDYSNEGNTYIYQIKYTDDLLATGLTNTTYQYTEEKMIFKKQKDGKLEMAVGNFVDFADIKNISENNYLKIDIKSVIKYYSIEVYTIKLTNRTQNTIVIADGQENGEITLNLKSSENRNRNEEDTDIVLGPNESRTIGISFPKFYDNNDDSQSITFGAIRVMEQYSGTENIADEVIQAEIQNAIAKFSVNIPVTYND